jgi:hypothetical protein
MLARDSRWLDHAVVRRLAREVLPRSDAREVDPAAFLKLSHEHSIPPRLIGAVHEILGA